MIKKENSSHAQERLLLKKKDFLDNLNEKNIDTPQALYRLCVQHRKILPL